MDDLKEFADKEGKFWEFVWLSDSLRVRFTAGALIRNDCLDFRCLNQALTVENSMIGLIEKLLAIRLTFQSHMARKLSC